MSDCSSSVSSSVTEGRLTGDQQALRTTSHGKARSSALQGRVGGHALEAELDQTGPESFRISTRLFDGGTQNMLKFFSDIKLGGKGGSKDNY